MAVRIELHRSSFESRERRLLEAGEFNVSAFRYDSGIEALRVCNARGEIILLPFKGQQIWRAGFDGRDLTMRSMFDDAPATARGGASRCFSSLARPTTRPRRVLVLPRGARAFPWSESVRCSACAGAGATFSSD